MDIVEELEVTVVVVDQRGVAVLEVEGVVETEIAEPGADGRGEPLTDIDVDSGATDAELGLLGHDGVDTTTDVDEPVVTSFVGEVRTADDVAFRVTVVVLLRES